jgi:adenine-specific DNA-methyltransferase
MKKIEQYTHKHKKRANNPPVGLVTPETDKETRTRKYEYDPHLDPSLQWASKAERTSFEIQTVSLHVHERIDPRTIIEAVKKKEPDEAQLQGSLFEMREENPPLREAIEFYKHKHNWSNRLVAGDSLLVMNSLIEKEGMAGAVQMIYIDPPYGIRYGSNFQPFVNKRDVKDGRDEDLTQEPETLKAFRDTWELGIHSYLTYMRDRLFLARELLSESGSIFVQISDENVHLIRNLMDEIFGTENFVSLISIKKSSVMFAKKLLNSATFYIVWYSKDVNKIKYRNLYASKELQWFADNAGSHLWIENPETKVGRKVTPQEREDIVRTLDNLKGWRLYGTWSLNAQGTEKQVGYEYNKVKYYPPKDTQWKTSYEGLDRLKNANRLEVEGNNLRFKIYYEDYPVMPINDLWTSIGAPSEKIYAVQTANEVIKRCLLMTTDPSDLVLDITCGSGTTAFVSEQWGRRWVTCDTSRVAVALARQRLMTAVFDYYELAQPDEGIASGFKYKTVPHITLKSIANNEPPAEETLYDKPKVDSSRQRVTGPFTVEAVPALTVGSLSEIEEDLTSEADNSVARSGETLRQNEWRDELLRTGIRGRGGERLNFSRVEPLSGTKYLHADAELTDNGSSSRAVVSFGPEHAPLEQKQVELALEEANKLFPRPKMIVFAAFQFDPEAAKDIDETNWPGVSLLKAQMNADLLTNDLKKKRASNESFWLIGQPDVQLRKLEDGKYEIEVMGFDYYNTVTGELDQGGVSRIAIWMLDTDYDGRSLFPRQVFFPMSGEKDGWSRLAKNLKAEIDMDLIEAFRGNVSLPFTPGRRVAVKIVDDRGIESIRIMETSD